MTIQIVTDSTAYITREEIEQHNIKVVPLRISFEGEDRGEGIPGEYDDFFERLIEGEDFPITSQPSPQAYAEVYEAALAEGKEVIVLALSSKLSGTYNSAVLAAEMVGSERISVIDTLTSAAILKHFAIKASQLAQAGKGREAIVKQIETEKHQTGIYFTVETLVNLKRSGRLSSAKAFVGSLLNVKPIIKLDAGKLKSTKTVRGKRRAVKTMLDEIPSNVKKIYVPHILNEAGALELRETLLERYPHIDVEVTVLGPIVGATLGLGAIGLCFLW